MKIEFNNLYTHFVFITLKRQPVIPEKSRVRIEKYITGIVKNNSSKLYAIYANPGTHTHSWVKSTNSFRGRTGNPEYSGIVQKSSSMKINL
jgi:hypothetical protein